MKAGSRLLLVAAVLVSVSGGAVWPWAIKAWQSRRRDRLSIVATSCHGSTSDMHTAQGTDGGQQEQS